MLRIAVTFDVLYIERFVDLSCGEHFLQRPLTMVRETNEFEDADLWKK